MYAVQAPPQAGVNLLHSTGLELGSKDVGIGRSTLTEFKAYWDMANNLTRYKHVLGVGLVTPRNSSAPVPVAAADLAAASAWFKEQVNAG